MCPTVTQQLVQTSLKFLTEFRSIFYHGTVATEEWILISRP